MILTQKQYMMNQLRHAARWSLAHGHDVESGTMMWIALYSGRYRIHVMFHAQIVS